MNPIIDKEFLLKEKMKCGVNLFTGAGFSTLPYKGASLPTADELCTEICEKYNISLEFGYDLEEVSALVPNQSYQSFLRERFRVTGCNELYNKINNINIQSLITTNIDNIPYCFISNVNRYYLKNILYYGANKSKNANIDYIPLHGDVINLNLPLYFGKFDLSIVEEINKELFNEMESRIFNTPTIFWGYGFHDKGVLKSIKRVLTKKIHDFWVQCMPNDKKMINFFRQIGANVIIADTESLLQWIGNTIIYSSNHEKDKILSNDLRQFLIPSITDSKLETLPASEYYVKGVTQWYSILTGQAYETSMVNKVYNDALQNKNTIVIGGDFVGKTTLLMQLAKKIESTNKIFIKDAISREEANFILSKLDNEETWVFCAKGSLDIDALCIFAKADNIKLISTTEDYSFESSKHLLDSIPHIKIEMGELDQFESERIYEHIPISLRKENFSYKESDDEKYSMLELISKNVNGVFTQQRITNILLSIQSKNQTAIRTIALASYLMSCDSALSTDIIYSFFNITEYKEVLDIISSVNSVLNDFDIQMSNDDANQDYFILRSKFFAKYASESFLRNRNLNHVYAEVIRDFTYKVSILKIYNYYIFKRKAYDGVLFANLFQEDGNKIYDFLYDKYKSPYTLQQRALFLGKLHKFAEAFSYIDKAHGELPNNFSIKNSKAILLFEANKEIGTGLAISQMDEAMRILEECYINDKRKVYHAQKYAEFSIFFYKEYKIDSYITKANKWISEIKSSTQKTLYLKKNLKFILS